MASSKKYLDFVLEQLSGLEEITYRAMMGEYILYYRGKIVGGIYDDRLLVKPAKKQVANIITLCRILGSIGLVFCPVFSACFYGVYLFCGLTDMADGTIARKTAKPAAETKPGVGSVTTRTNSGSFVIYM